MKIRSKQASPNVVKKMKTFLELGREEVVWSGQWDYTVRSGEDVFGKIHVQNDMNLNAVAESCEGSWRFKKVWWPTPKVILHSTESNREVAFFRRTLHGKRKPLEFPYGQRFYWESAGFRLNRSIFKNRFGDLLLHFQRYSSPFTAMFIPRGSSSGIIEIENHALSLPELPMLTLLGCYLMIVDAL
jgi:hypothetical protein